MNPKRDFGHIGKTQRAVIDDILVHGLSERETLEKHKVSPSRYRRWLENGVFRRELDIGIESASRQAKLTVVLSLPKVAALLVKLINSEKDETARKACLDIIKLQKADQEQEKAERAEQDKQEDSSFKMTDAQAAKIWAIMAEKDEPETEPQASATGGMAKSDTERSEARQGYMTTDTLPPSQDSSMSYGERIEKYGLPKPERWPQPPKEPALSDSEWVDEDCIVQPDTNNEQPETSNEQLVAPNPEKQAALQHQRDAALSIELANHNRRLLARPQRGIDLSAQNQNNFVIRSY